MTVGISFIHVISSRSRKIKISLDRQGGVVVTTPKGILKSQLLMYVEKARGWIETERLKIKKTESFLDSNSVMFFGERLKIEVVESGDGSVKVFEGEVRVSKIPGKKVSEIMERWLKARGTEYILELLPLWAKKMGVKHANVSFKKQKSRWGSCSSMKNLSFNWQLVHAPPDVIDYVIIHELSHIVHMNHGNQFWELVAKYDPDYPLHRGWLKRYGGGTD